MSKRSAKVWDVVRVLDIQGLEAQLKMHGFAGDLIDDRASQVVYGTDNSIYELQPELIVVPRTSQDVAALVRANNDLENSLALVARGGGTGTNGQALSSEVVVDFRRKMNSIVKIDPQMKRAVVEPGVVLEQLNSALGEHSLKFAPHTSAGTRATIGGMVATDAAGKGSLVHGRTNRHVVGLEVVLFDGSTVVFRRPGTELLMGSEQDVLQAATRSQVKETLSGIGIGLLPKVERGWSGYNIGGAAGDPIDYTKLFCGAEGTLGFVTAVEVELIHDEPPGPTVIASFDSFAKAISASVHLKESGPAIIECIDNTTISLAEASITNSILNGLIDLSGRSILILEYPSFVQSYQVQKDIEEIADNFAVLDSPELVEAVWKLRSDAVGFLAKPTAKGTASVAFVEDTMVPPSRLEAYISDFTALLDSYDLEYGMFGHADVGCVHVRPALNLELPEHQRLVRTLTEKVNQLVQRYGGVLWGEHGRGFRGTFNNIPDEIMLKMREIKTAFDPQNCFNPRKLYAPLTTDQAVLHIDSINMRADSNKVVATSDREVFSTAFDCNGNGICHDWDGSANMCPSYKATLDPRLSPKGRADLIRSWLIEPENSELADQVADSLHQCLSCNACTSDCPVSVDIPELKSKFFEKYGASSRREYLRQSVIGSFEKRLPMLSRIPLSGVLAKIAGFGMGLIDLPKVKGKGPRSLARKHGVPLAVRPGSQKDISVIVLSDSFSTYLEPDVLDAAISVLTKLGEKPAISPFVPTNKYFHVKGMRTKFAKATIKQRKFINKMAKFGVPIVSLEPAVTLLYRNEYLEIDPEFPQDLVEGLHEFLETKMDGISIRSKQAVTLFDHCSSGTAGELHAPYLKLFESLGVVATAPDLTCCGMAGIFGHEKENSKMSRKLFDDYWRPELDSNLGAELLAAGYSCRSQAKRGDWKLLHPIQYLNSVL